LEGLSIFKLGLLGIILIIPTLQGTTSKNKGLTWLGTVGFLPFLWEISAFTWTFRLPIFPGFFKLYLGDLFPPHFLLAQFLGGPLIGINPPFFFPPIFFPPFFATLFIKPFFGRGSYFKPGPKYPGGVSLFLGENPHLGLKGFGCKGGASSRPNKGG